MSTKYEIGGHLIDANGGRHEIMSVENLGGSGPELWSATINQNRHRVWCFHYRYEPPAKPEPTRFEVGQVWEINGFTMEPRIISDNGDCAVCITRRGETQADSVSVRLFSESIDNGWKLKEGA